MKSLPERASLAHLRKQAKTRLRDARGGEADAIARIRSFLPAARGATPQRIAAMPLHLHAMRHWRRSCSTTARAGPSVTATAAT